MTEYISREALIEDLRESYNRLRKIYDSLKHDEDKQICAGQLTTFTEAILRVKEAPAADVVEVCRCMNCQKFDADEIIAPKTGTCWHHKMIKMFDDFCSNGKKRAKL